MIYMFWRDGGKVNIFAAVEWGEEEEGVRACVCAKKNVSKWKIYIYVSEFAMTCCNSGR